MANKLIVSASRREDIISNINSYRKLQSTLTDGVYTCNSIYSGISTKILKLNDIGAVVLWSKNYSNFLKNPGVLDNYNLYFEFTITGYGKLIESNVPNYNVTISQMKELATKYGPEKINWRFDPIAFFMLECSKQESIKERLKTFEILCKEISKLGIYRCTISFMDLYNVVSKRLDRLNIKYFILTEEEKILFLNNLTTIANKYNIKLFSCSNPEMKAAGINASSCIDGSLLSKLFNIKFDSKKDRGQRESCNCSKSLDIGSYVYCPNNCAYCYNSTV